MSHDPLATPPIHVGFAVTDLAESMDHFTRLLGLSWLPADFGLRGVFATDQGECEWVVDVVKSPAGPGQLELLCGGPGSVWAGLSAGFHHLAYASHDVAGDTATLIAAGWSLEVTRPGPTPSFAYLVRPGHPRVELCPAPEEGSS